MVIVADENEVVEEKAKDEGGGGKNPILTVLVLVNTLMMGAIAYFQFSAFDKISKQPNIQDLVKAEMKKNLEAESNDTGEAKVKEGILFPLEGFTANLAQGDGPRRFIRLSAVLKFSKDSSEDEFKRRKPQIRDTVITTLNSKRPEDLLSVQGKSFLKEEIKAAINSFLVDGHVIDMFYVNFQVE